MTVLDIHIEGIRPEHFGDGDPLLPLQQLRSGQCPVALSIAPWQIEGEWFTHDHGQQVLDLVRELAQKPQVVIGQQGNSHKCAHNHRLVDPWHENRCLWRLGGFSFEQQRAFMLEGRHILHEFVGVEPTLYVPPNHQFDRTTLDVAADIGYSYFADRAMIPHQPYKHGGSDMIIVPEGDLRTGDMQNAMSYIHYDEIAGSMPHYRALLIDGTDLQEVVPGSVSSRTILSNTFRKHVRKYGRDLIKLPKRIISRE